MSTSDHRHARAGVAYAVGAYGFWGVAPVYFMLVKFAGPAEVLAHRVIWSVPLMAVLVTVARQWPTLRGLSASQVKRLALCSALLSSNWFIFIYGVHSGRIAETALGYFINPLVSIILARLVLGERMRPLQWVAAGIAAAGVAVELYVAGSVPVIALALAMTFGLYGLLRKQLALASSVGLAVEVSVLAPFALAYLLLGVLADNEVQRSIGQIALLGLGGAVTVIPLIWFASAATRLPLSILGFIQYLAPSIALMLAVVVYGETVSASRWTSFAMIWTALAVLSAEALWHFRKAASRVRP